jgi:muscleblind protein
MHHSSVEELTIVCQDFLRGQCNRKSCRYSHVVAHPVPPMSHVPMPYPEMLYMPPPPPPPLGVPMMGPPPSPPRPFSDNKNRVEVCRDFLKNMCNRESCRFLHPDTHTVVCICAFLLPCFLLVAELLICNFHFLHLFDQATSENVEICRDFKRGECNRPACRFFHPYTS